MKEVGREWEDRKRAMMGCEAGTGCIWERAHMCVHCAAMYVHCAAMCVHCAAMCAHYAIM